MVRFAHAVCVPDIIAHTALHPPDVAACDVQRHRLDGLAFQRTQLANHVVEKVLAGLASRKTPSEAVVKRPEFIKESVDIMGDEIKLRDGEPFVFGSLGR
jgi:hypothetical protein